MALALPFNRGTMLFPSRVWDIGMRVFGQFQEGRIQVIIGVGCVDDQSAGNLFWLAGNERYPDTSFIQGAFPSRRGALLVTLSSPPLSLVKISMVFLRYPVL
jgi:hypothetical protein